tara:strand:+ start:389 stop:796 length:408 start_codon:yes stop_codon:yes gene_type:complete
MMLQVQCPSDGEKCLVADCDIKEQMVLLGDDQQNMQCTNCGFASNQKYKGEIGDILENYPKDFINVCKEVNNRWWIPAIYQTEKYMIAPKVVDDKLTWVIRPQQILNAEDVEMPTFYDAYVVIQLMETRGAELQK